MKKWLLILPLVGIVIAMAVVPYTPGPPEGDRVPFAKITNAFLGEGMSFEHKGKPCVGWTMIIFTGYVDRVYSIQHSIDPRNITWDEVVEFKNSSAVIYNDPIYRGALPRVYRVVEVK